MTVFDQDVTIIAGDRVDLRYTVTDDATGEAVNVVPATAVAWQMSRIFSRSDGTDDFSSTPAVSKSLGSGIVVGPAQNLIVVSLNNVDTKSLVPGRYRCELQITSLSGSGPYTVARGEITLLKELIK